MADIYKPHYFADVIDKLPERFYIQSEFAFSKSKEEVIKTGILLDDSHFDTHSLCSADLEDLIFCLVHHPSEAVVSTLTERASNRLLGLMWAFFQYNYDNDYVIRTLSAIKKKYTKYQFDVKKGQIIFINDFLEDSLGTPVALALSRQEKMCDILSKYEIIEHSPYWYDMLTRFFIQSPADILKENFDLLYRFFSVKPIPVTPLIRYLDVLDPDDFSPDICLLIIDEFGLPGKSDFWLDYPDFFAKKITDWYKIYIISMTLNPESAKYKILSSYADKIRDVVYDTQNKILKILFKSFSLIDDLSGENFCVFCSDPVASLNVRSVQTLSIQYAAKHFVVDGVTAEYMYLYFSGLDKMYTNEMLNIMLGITDTVSVS